MARVAARASFSLVWLMVLLFLLQHSSSCKARVIDLSIKDDSRVDILFEKFGFTSKGQLEMELSGVSWTSSGDPFLMGFFIATDDEIMQFEEELEQQSINCALRSTHVNLLCTFADVNADKEFKKNFSIPSAGQYALIFVNCLAPATVSMNIKTAMYNLEDKTGAKVYLSEGETQLPTLFFVFFLLYVVLGGVWTYICVKQKETAQRIHIFMGVLVILKALYLFSDAEEMAYIKRTGTPHGWDIAFYAFGFLKGVMLFTVIALIGTGWSILKPFLQGKEKKVLVIVIPLQVMENIAFVVMNETGLSGKDWLTWYQVLLLVDVICCCAVLFPIVWSIKHLREAAHTDGKAARNLVKLTLFRQYYIVVVSYIYVTRILVAALKTVLSYHYLWVYPLAYELATVAFYIFTGYKFRPVPHNPYFVLDEEEEEAAAEAAFKDDDFEL